MTALKAVITMTSLMVGPGQIPLKGGSGNDTLYGDADDTIIDGGDDTDLLVLGNWC